MRTTFRSASGCQFKVTSTSPGNICHLEPSASSTRWLSLCLRILIYTLLAFHRRPEASGREVVGSREDRDAGEDKEGYGPGYAPVQAVTVEVCFMGNPLPFTDSTDLKRDCS